MNNESSISWFTNTIRSRRICRPNCPDWVGKRFVKFEFDFIDNQIESKLNFSLESGIHVPKPIGSGPGLRNCNIEITLFLEHPWHIYSSHESDHSLLAASISHHGQSRPWSYILQWNLSFETFKMTFSI